MPGTTLSQQTRIAMNAQNTSEMFHVLLTMTHDLITQPMNFVNDLQGITSNGVPYVAWPFDLPLPETGTDTLPTLTLTIDNVDKSIWTALKPISTPIDVTLSWVLRSNPNSVEGGPLYLRMVQTELGFTTITGTLNFEDLLNMPYPPESFTPGSHAGLF